MFIDSISILITPVHHNIIIVLQKYQYKHGGGGSGGSLWVVTDEFEGQGHVLDNGGDGRENGGGGAGGMVVIKYRRGSFKSGHVQAKGMNIHVFAVIQYMNLYYS